MPRKRPAEMQREATMRKSRQRIDIGSRLERDRLEPRSLEAKEIVSKNKTYLIFEEQLGVSDIIIAKNMNEAINKHIELNVDLANEVEILIVEALAGAKVERFKCKKQYSLEIAKQ
jgi:hypothetical protein